MRRLLGGLRDRHDLRGRSMNLYPEAIALENTRDRFCDQRRGSLVFHGQDFQLAHNPLRKIPSGPNHVHSIPSPDPVLPPRSR